jgi:protein arginine kinase
MIPVQQMLSARAQWFDGSGPRADEILSTRVRLARNVAGFRFVGRAREEELEAVFEKARASVAAAPLLSEGAVTGIDELLVLDRHFLLERHLLSHDLTAEAKHRGLAFARDESLSVMINEEDHLRLQCLKSGMQLDEAWELVNRLDDQVGERLPLAFQQGLGYLTACPTNVGTGMRASVLVHLPSLVLTQRIKKVLTGVTQVGLAVRGFHGEGSEVVGNFFQISNQVTLGVSEAGTIEKLQGVVLQILDMEAKARESLLRDARAQVEDKVGRALGTLKYARLLSSQEAMGLLSAMRFGVTIGLTNTPDLATLNEILLYCQPAHLQKLVGREMASEERNEVRAQWIQQRLKVADAPAFRTPGEGPRKG